MTTETLTPTADNQPPPVAPDAIPPVAPPAAGATPPGEPSAQPFDFFDNELAQLQAEAAREQAVATATPATEGRQFSAEADGAKPAQPAAAPPRPAAPITVPIQRLTEETGKVRALQDQLAFLQGQLTALQRQRPQDDPDAAQPAQPTAPPTVDQRIKHMTAERLAIAEKYERGDITFVDWQLEAARIDAEMLKLATTAAQQSVQQNGPDVVTQFEIEAVKREFEAHSPWAWVYDDQSFKPVLEKAATALAMRGWTPQTPGYAAEHLRVTAYFAEKDGPDTFGITHQQADAYARQNAAPGVYKGRRAPAAGGSPAGGPAPKPAAPMTSQAQARAGKLDLAARMPPDIGNGSTTTPTGPISEADILSMSDDAIAALPKEIRQRVLNQLY